MSATAGTLELLTKFVHAREEKPKWALFALKSEVAELLPENRVKICYHHRVPNAETVEVWYSPESARAYYRNLMKCGQVWVCPVCAGRIAEIRRVMLRAAIDNSSTRYLPVLVTYTARHYRGQSLKDLLDRMVGAYREMRHSRLWKTYKDEYLIVGEIRAVEITWNDNGWHPHFHVITFLDLDILRYIKDENDDYHVAQLCSALESHLSALWIESLAKFKLSAETGPALNVRSSWALLDDYITKGGTVLPKNTAKWTMAEETTKSQFKKAHAEGLTPWDLLIEAFCGIPDSGALFVEYVEATKGRSSLQWTPGLKDKTAVSGDEDDLASQDESALDEILLMSLEIEQWREVVQTQAIGVLLDAANTGDPAKVKDVLREVSRRASTIEHVFI